jgi:hypothetical protein
MLDLTPITYADQYIYVNQGVGLEHNTHPRWSARVLEPYAYWSSYWHSVICSECQQPLIFSEIRVLKPF